MLFHSGTVLKCKGLFSVIQGKLQIHEYVCVWGKVWKENRSLCHPRQVADLAEGDSAPAQPALCVAVLLGRGQGPDCSKDSELPVLTSVEGS